MPGRERMDVSCLIEATRPLDRILRDRVVGQDPAIDALVCSYEVELEGATLSFYRGHRSSRSLAA